LVHLELERIYHIVAHQFEVGAAVQMGDVALPPGEKVIETDDIVAVLEETVTEVRTKEAGAAGDKYAHKKWEEMFR